MSNTYNITDDSGSSAYSIAEAARLMDDLPETAQTVVQELWYGDSHQNTYDLEQHTDLTPDAVDDAVTALEDTGLVRSRPELVSGDDRVYWLHVEDDA